MVTDRRSFVRGAAAALGLAAWGPVAFAAARDGEPLLASARSDGDGNHSAAIFDLAGRDVASVALPGRGHDITVRPGTRECVAFARRPGNFAVVFDADRKRGPSRFTTRADRHFYGHGIFSPDGRLLFTTENNFDDGTGVIGIRDATAGYTQIGEIPSHGVGPHDLALLSDGRTLVIANGGIATHPDYGRAPLNLASMEPSLAYVDSEDGALLERHTLGTGLDKLSIRHLAVGEGDAVVFGCQHKGAKIDRPPLIGLHRRQLRPHLIEAGEAQYRLMRNYVSSVAVDSAGTTAAATSSKGGVVVIIDIAARRISGQRRLADVSGAAPRARAGAFAFTTGHGEIVSVGSSDPGQGAIATPWVWDNHLAAL